MACCSSTLVAFTDACLNLVRLTAEELMRNVSLSLSVSCVGIIVTHRVDTSVLSSTETSDLNPEHLSLWCLTQTSLQSRKYETLRQTWRKTMLKIVSNKKAYYTHLPAATLPFKYLQSLCKSGFQRRACLLSPFSAQLNVYFFAYQLQSVRLCGTILWPRGRQTQTLRLWKTLIKD